MYSREEPSPRYRKLTELYRRMHVEGDRTIGMPSEQTFAGGSVLRHVPEIKKLIDETGAQTLLDYGAGKGHQYAWRDVELPNGSRVESLTAYWEVTDIALYDPGYEPLTSMPSGTFILRHWCQGRAVRDHGRRSGRSRRVFACEPQATNLAPLVRNIAANDLARVITPCNFALHGHEGFFEFNYASLVTGSSTASSAASPCRAGSLSRR